MPASIRTCIGVAPCSGVAAPPAFIGTMLGGTVGAGIGFGAGVGVGFGVPGVGAGPGFVGPGTGGGRPSGPGAGVGVAPGCCVVGDGAGVTGFVADGDSVGTFSGDAIAPPAASPGTALGFDGPAAVDWPSSCVGTVSSSRA